MLTNICRFLQFHLHQKDTSKKTNVSIPQSFKILVHFLFYCETRHEKASRFHKKTRKKQFFHFTLFSWPGYERCHRKTTFAPPKSYLNSAQVYVCRPQMVPRGCVKWWRSSSFFNYGVGQSLSVGRRKKTTKDILFVTRFLAVSVFFVFLWE